jgi:hypothetical protein
MMYISPMRYGFNGMMLKQFPSGEPGTEEYEAGEAKLVTLGIDKHTYWGCVCSLIFLLIAFRGTVILILWV